MSVQIKTSSNLRYFIFIFLLLNNVYLSAQVNGVADRNKKDTCTIPREEIMLNSVRGTRHANPVYMTNGVVTRLDQISKKHIEGVTVLKCREAFNKIGYAGVNGIVMVKNRQEFKTLTPTSIRNSESISGKIIYALNGYFLSDSTLEISKKAIEEIQILKTEGANENSLRPTIINIWTLKKDERLPTYSICRGITVEK